MKLIFIAMLCLFLSTGCAAPVRKTFYTSPGYVRAVDQGWDRYFIFETDNGSIKQYSVMNDMPIWMGLHANIELEEEEFGDYKILNVERVQ